MTEFGAEPEYSNLRQARTRPSRTITRTPQAAGQKGEFLQGGFLPLTCSVQFGIIRILVDDGRLDSAFAIAESVASPVFQSAALLELRLGLSQAGRKDEALQIAYRIAGIPEGIEDPVERAQAWVIAFQALGGIGEGAQAAGSLTNAILACCLAGRPMFFETLTKCLQGFGSIDEGRTLWEIHEALRDADLWWSRVAGPGVLNAVARQN